MAMFTSPPTPEEIALRGMNDFLSLGLHEAVWAALLSVLFTLAISFTKPLKNSQRIIILTILNTLVFFYLLYLMGEVRLLLHGLAYLPIFGLAFYVALRERVIILTALNAVIFLYVLGFMEGKKLLPYGFAFLPFIGAVIYAAFRAALKVPERHQGKIKALAIPAIALLLALHVYAVYIWVAQKPVVCCRKSFSDRPPQAPGVYKLFDLPAFNCSGDCPPVKKPGK
jgi:hypothetical protein